MFKLGQVVTLSQRKESGAGTDSLAVIVAITYGELGPVSADVLTGSGSFVPGLDLGELEPLRAGNQCVNVDFYFSFWQRPR